MFLISASFYWTLLIVLVPYAGFTQCNGYLELCDKRFNEVAYITTHNAYNAEDVGLLFPNHNFGVAAQLEAGVRGFMLDVYNEGGIATQYHGFAALGTVPLTDDLTRIKDFLDANPNEVVTIIFECYITSTLMDSTFTDVGLIPYLHEQELGQPWPTLQTMINNGKRLIVLSDSDDATVGQEWYHYVWDFAVETHFTNNLPSDFSCDFNRGDSLNDLFILNHFVTDATVGVGLPDQAEIVNEFSFFYNRVMQCQTEKQKLPNFLTVDFYELGEVFAVADSINGVQSSVGISERPILEYSIQPESEIGVYMISTAQPMVNFEIRNALGQVVQIESQIMQSNIRINLNPYLQGIYFVTLRSVDNRLVTIKLMR